MQDQKDASNKRTTQRCTHYNDKKKRYCRQIISPWIPDSFASDPNFQPLYCGNHSNLYSVLFKDQKRQKIIHTSGSKGKRIPCPIDPSHMIYEHNVKSHLSKCPKAKVARDKKDMGYYVPNINGGGHGSRQHYRKLMTTQEAINIDPLEFAKRVLHVFRNTFSSFEDTNVNGNHQNHQSDTDVTSMTFDEIYTAVPNENLFSTLLLENKVELEDIVQSHRIKIGGHKHLEQIGSMLGHAQKHDLLCKTNTVLEMGAGRATTGFVISGACCAQTQKNVRLVLVERSGSRSKADSALRRIHSQVTNNNNNSNDGGSGDHNDGGRMGTSLKESNDIAATTSTSTSSSSTLHGFFRPEGVDFHRIKCDLAHVSLANVMSNLEELNNTDNVTGATVGATSTTDVTAKKRDILVIAKHLCGAGTDLALKSLIQIRDRVCGCIMATCCHGVCSWEHYVGRDYLASIMCLEERYKDVGFGEEEFNIMKRWATGTVIVDRHSQSGSINEEDEEGEDHPTTVTAAAAAADVTATTTEKVQEQEDHFPRSSQEMSVTRVASILGLQCGPQGLGRACQRLIDYGRCEYMRKEILLPQHSNVSLVHYVEPHITPQNAMLLGLLPSNESSTEQ